MFGRKNKQVQTNNYYIQLSYYMWDRKINGTKKLFSKSNKGKRKSREKGKKNIFLKKFMYDNVILQLTFI